MSPLHPWRTLAAVLACSALAAGEPTAAKAIFADDFESGVAERWKGAVPIETVAVGTGGKALQIAHAEAAGVTYVHQLGMAGLAGRTLRLSARTNGQGLTPAGAAMVALHVTRTNGMTFGSSLKLKGGTWDWETGATTLDIPNDARELRVFLGLGKAQGILLIDDLSIEIAEPARAATEPSAAPLPETACERIAGLLVPREEDEGFGCGLQRTMRLLASSTAEYPNTVRILCYGQSIIAQPYLAIWLKGELGRRYPTAKLVVENRAIGGYEAPLLIRTAESDIVPFRPDLVIFHVYGGEKDGTYEAILRIIRGQTNAELLSWTDHWAATGGEALPATYAPEKPIARRDLVLRYGGEVADVRSIWHQTLRQNNLGIKSLLIDGIHPNPQGGTLLAAIVGRHFRPYQGPIACDERGSAAIDLTRGIPDAVAIAAGAAATVAGLALGKDRTMSLRFTGNRVDLIGARAEGGRGVLRVTIDGHRPSETAACLVASRSGPYPRAWFPAINRITLGANAVPETWTFAFTGLANPKAFAFTATGSVTGADGDGTAGKLFTSRSGRIAIEPRDLTFALAPTFGIPALPDTLQVTSTVSAMVSDEVEIGGEPAAAPLTVYLSRSGGPHLLELRAVGPASITVPMLRIGNPQERL